MSINWVMVSPQSADPFVKLPNERILYTSPPRTSLALSSPSTYPGTQPWSIKSDNGIVYITNQRIVYLPTHPTPDLQTFSAPILHLTDTYARAPFFGANYWTATLRPVPGGGVPAPHPLLDLRLTFREGGAFDYHAVFEELKERVTQTAQLAREDGQEVDLRMVHLEQLPAYEPAREVSAEPDVGLEMTPPPTREGEVERREDSGVVPDEPPPGYEEAQAQAVGMSLERRLREDVERGRGGEED